MADALLDGNVTDQNGAAVPGALIYIYDGRGESGGLSTLRDSMSQETSNPVTADANGYWAAYAAKDQFYTVVYYWGGRKRFVEANVLLGEAGINIDPNVRADVENGAVTLAGVANLLEREAPTAAALEELAANKNISGYPGVTHTVETTPHPSRLDLDLQGAAMENVSPDAFPGTSTITQGCLNLGHVHPTARESVGVAKLSVASVNASDPRYITLTTPADANSLIVGAIYEFIGNTTVALGAITHRLYLNRRKVLAKDNTTGVVLLDRALESDLIADAPLKVVLSDGTQLAPTGETYRMLDRPHLRNGRLVTPGIPITRQGVYQAKLDNLDFDGYAGPSFNALDYSVITHSKVRAFAKFFEFADHSKGSLISGLSGSLYDNPSYAWQAFGGQIGEFSRGCVAEHMNLDTGPKTFVSGQVLQIAGGSEQSAMRHGIIYAPKVTGTILATWDGTTGAGADAEFSDFKIFATAPAYFIYTSNPGGGLKRWKFRDIVSITGTPTIAAARLDGQDGLMENCRLTGAINLVSTLTGTSIRYSYATAGFGGMTDALRVANFISDNLSDATIAANQAATITKSTTVINSTTANNIYKSTIFPAGSLNAGDRIRLLSRAWNVSGATARNGRVSVLSGGTTTALATGSSSTSGGYLGFEMWMFVIDATHVAFFATNPTGGISSAQSMAVSDLTTDPLQINQEYWCASSSDTIVIRHFRCLPVFDEFWHHKIY